MKRRFLAGLSTVALVISLAITVSPPSSAQMKGQEGGSGDVGALATDTGRVAGVNRYATAAAAAERFGKASAVILANGEDRLGGADALAANYLAGLVRAPILLVSSSGAPLDTVRAAARTLAGVGDAAVYVMGGAASVPETAVQQVVEAAEVAGATVKVTRIAGADRYETSALVAAYGAGRAGTVGFGGGATSETTAILVSGTTNADALAAGPLAYAWHLPILLTGATSLPKSVVELIDARHITQLIVLGGTDRIGSATVNSAKKAGATRVKRIAGSDRFETATMLYAFATSTAIGPGGTNYGPANTVYLANGVTGFPDALAAGPLAGSRGDVLLTVGAGHLPDSVGKLIAALDSVRTIVGLGSPSSVPAESLAAAAGARAGVIGLPEGTSEADSGDSTGGVGGGPPGEEDTAAPTVTAVSPASGPVVGGAVITITGLNLSGATTVLIGDNEAIHVDAISSTTVTATTPVGLVGQADVRVVTANGVSAAAPGATYTYLFGADHLAADYAVKAATVSNEVDDVLAVTGGSSIEDAAPESWTVVLAAGVSRPTIGSSYYLAPDSTVYPSGLAGVIQSVADGDGGTYIVTVTAAPLDSVMEKVDVQYSGPLGGSEGSPLRSIRSAAIGAEHGTSGTVTFANIPGSVLECADTATVSGTIAIKLDETRASVDIQLGAFSSAPSVKAIFSYDVVLEGSLSVSGKSQCALSSIWRSASTVRVPIPGTGLFAEVSPTLSFSASAAGSVQLTKRTHHTIGLYTLEDGTIKTIDSKSAEPAGIVASGTLKADMSVGADIDLVALGTVGVGISTALAGTASASVIAAPLRLCVTLNLSLKSALHAKLKLWIGDFTATLPPFIDKPLVEHEACIPLTSPPEIETDELPAARVGYAYSADLEATGGVSGTWSVTAGQLPGGLTLHDATIVGTPIQAGSTTLEIMFTDKNLQSTTKELILTVLADVSIDVVRASCGAAEICAAAGSITVNGVVMPTLWTLGTDESEWSADFAPAVGGQPAANIEEIACGLDLCIARGTLANGNTAVWQLSIIGWTGALLPMPSGVDRATADYKSSSCDAAGVCVVTGTVKLVGNNLTPMLWTYDHGRWTLAIPPAPDGLDSYYINVGAVSCGGALCVADGGYVLDVNDKPAALWMYNLGDWTLSQPRPPASLGPSAEVSRYGRADCFVSGDCVTVGTVAANGENYTVMWTFAGGQWNATIVTDADGVAANDVAAACSVNGLCVAVAGPAGTAWERTDGQWHQTEVPIPDDAGPVTWTPAGNLACNATGVCTFAGNYMTAGGRRSALWTVVDNTWTVNPAQEASELGIPVGATWQLACGATMCVAAEDYIGNDNWQGAVWTLSAGVWSATASPTFGNATPSATGAEAVACAPVGKCIAAGRYVPMADWHGSTLWALSDTSSDWVIKDAPLPMWIGF